jgi:lysophospholipase L1-like esterase
MSSSLGRIALALMVAIAGLVVGVGTAAHADAVPRIMLAGDSITQGFDGDFTWRYRLFQEFSRQATPVDFVGPRRYTYGGSHVYLAGGWDSDHDAIGGSTLRGRVSDIRSDVATYSPDVLVALYGTNDLLNGATVSALITSWRGYVASARSARPDVKLVLGEVATPKAADRGTANAALHALAAELGTEQSPIVVADLESPAWVPSRHSRDRVHPNPTGETLIAQRVAEALQSLGVLTATPQIARAHVPWTPPLRPTAHPHGGRIAISWRRTKHRYRVHETRVRWINLRTGRSVTRFESRRVTHLVTARLAPGRYRIQVLGVRGTTRSHWGVPVVRRVTR